MTVYTIGHSTRSTEELLSLLTDAGVELVADVRAFPSSRRHPQFNRGALAASPGRLKSAIGICPGLGGRRSPIPGSPNAGWQETAFQGYADHMSSEEFRRALAELKTEARERPTTIMCAEAVW